MENALVDEGVDPCWLPAGLGEYFAALLAERGRPSIHRTSIEAGYLKQPTTKQVEDYQQQPFVSDLARKGDIAGLQRAVEAGRGMVSHASTRVKPLRVAECARVTPTDARV